MNVPPKPFPEAASEPSREALLAALAERDRELDEARARQSATAEILRVISQSPTNARPVFDSIVMAAVRLLGCDLAFMLLCDGATFWTAALGSPGGLLPATGLGISQIDSSANFPSRAILAKEMLYLPDWSLVEQPEHERKVHELYGVNCSLYLPLLREGECIGLLTVVGKRPGVFGPGEIAQAESFRDQALIAIENARQFNEAKEALEQQTATAEILKVIASSPSDVQPVFEAIAESAKRLLGGYSCAVGRYVADMQHLEAFTSTNPDGDAVMKAYYPRPRPAKNSPIAQMIAREGFAEIADTEAVSDLGLRDYARVRGFRSYVNVPLRLDADEIGWIIVTRQAPGAFAPHHIQLLQTFADQAVIAIQNVRQFNETKEALERQTATAEILKVIASSPSDVQPVFDAIAASAKRLLGGYSAGVFRHIDDLIHLVAFTPIDPEGDAALQALYPRPLSEFRLVQMIRGGFAAQFEDTEAEDVPRANRDLARARRYRAMMFTPLMHHETPIGHIVVTRKEPGKFAPHHVQLLQTFADQAVIAIQNARQINETQEALERQTATSEVLRVIAGSPSDVQPVFEAIATNANRLVGGLSTAVWRFANDEGHLAAFTPIDPAADAALKAMSPMPFTRFPLFARVLDGEATAIVDTETDTTPALRDVARLRGYRSMLFTPLMSQGAAIGVISVTRKEPGSFAPHHVQLLRTFADQAVIAINNVALFNETQEALRQQTATADVLKVISRSAFDLQTVLETLIHSAVELCAANRGAVFLRDGDVFRWRAATGSGDEYAAYMRAHPQSGGRGSTVGRVILSGKVECISDVLGDPEFMLPANALVQTRATLGAPLLRDGKVEGVLVLTRHSPGPFTQRQIELVETFADQAVIAIENVRLFDEVQARTRDLTEALQQQTATADVLKVISRSAFDLDPVLVTLIGSAITLCEATRGVIWLRKGEHLRLAAHVNYPEEWVKAASELAITPAANATTASGIAAFTGEVVNIDDMIADPRFQSLPEHQLGNYRSALAVPMDRDGEVVGVIALSRPEARRFTDRQVALVKAFADQAVIAINNVGLFNETQEALRQQTATADVLKVISRSAFDLQTVFDTLLGSAVALSGADSGVLCVRDGDVFCCKSFVNKSPDLVRFLKENPIAPGPGSVMGRVALSGRIEWIEDTLADSALAMRNVIRRTNDDRALVGVPLLREGRIEGAIVLGRREPGRFSDRSIELTQTFADQAVIAIENVRLFDEVQARTRDLSEALQQQTATADVLKVISRSAFDLQAVLDTLIGSAIPLCEASRGAIWLRKGEQLRLAAQVGSSEEWVAAARNIAITPAVDATTMTGLAAFTGDVVNIEDITSDPRFQRLATRQATHYRGALSVPLSRDGEVVGVIGLTRPEAGRFTERQVALVKTFADQAVIAIENVRLFDEVQARTRDLSEALQQQTATADVLKVISRSAFDLQAVLDTLVQSAQRLCNARGSMIFVRDGEVYRIAAHVGMPEAFVSFRLANPLRADWITAVGRVALTGEMVHLPDALADPDIQKAGPQLGDFRAVLSVPLVREDEVVGIFALNRPEPGLFAPAQVKLVQTFADQAAIAIANVRLFNEVKTKTDDLSEALQQQTATADVLKVISRSAFDLQAVLDTLVESAVSLIGAASGVIWLRDGDVFNLKAASSAEEQQEFFAQLRARPQKPGRHSIGARVLLTGEVQIVSDIKTDPEYDPVIKAASNARALLGVPLLRDGVIIGAFVLALHRLGTFTPRQIELVQTFADQAVIAIENVRLFEEVQARTRDLSEALQQQTATADVLKVISRSAFDLDTVLQTLVESAARLCNAPQGVIHLREGDVVRAKAMVGHSGELMQRLRDTPRKAGRESIVPRVMLSGRVEHIDDALADPEFDLGGMDRDNLGFRGLLGVPLLREGKVEGVFVISSPKPGRFTDRQTELVQTFADQAVIAIENVRLFKEVQTKTDDLSEALQQQTATADVLKVISRSAFNLQAVLDTLVESAYRLSGAAYGLIYLRTGEDFECKAIGGMGAEEGDALFKGRPIRAGRSTAAERVILTGEIQSIPDLFEDPEFDPKIKAAIRGAVDSSPAFASLRSLIAVPMKRDAAVVGVIVIARAQTGLLPARQLELLQTFADQAVIAIENVRLFDEVQARTKDLQESLQQQTATADVLKVISRSAFDLQAVLNTLTASAVTLCGAGYGIIYLKDGDAFHMEAATTATPEPEFLEYLRRTPQRPGRGSLGGRLLLTGEIQIVADVQAELDWDPVLKATTKTRSLIGVPLKRDQELVGALCVAGPEPGGFNSRHIEILQTFADQAVIAIENARLFDEVQARTRDLSEALQQQTATAEVLKVISRSAFGLKTVLQTLVDSAVRLCASDGVIYLRDGDVFRAEAAFGADVAGQDPRNRSPRRPGRDSVTGRVALSGRVEQIPDNQADPEFKVVPAQRMNMRALLGVPLLRDGEVEGVFVLGKPEPGLFSDRAVELVRTFADQAVIAIQNVRLFDAVQAKTHDLEESLQLQTATSDVLKVISRSAFDLQAVFDTLIASAVEVCGAYSGIICVREEDVFRYRGSAGEGDNAALTKYLAEHPATPGRGSMAGRVLSSGKAEAIPDCLEDPEFVVPISSLGHAGRALMGVPLLGKAGIEGALVLTRKEPGYFADRQIEIVQTFADQAVIAIENVRLFDEVQARTRELAASLDDLRKTQDRLIQSEKLASLGQLTAGIAHEIKNPLNFVNNFSALSRELIDELAELLEKAPLRADQRDEANELIGMVSANLEKVVQHGKRADSIVKNMLLHSREGSGERSSVKVNAMVEEALNLAYHGARAEKPGFNVTIVKSLAPDAGAADLYAQEMTRVLLNLISNGFYATTKRRQVEANGAYEPTITASTRDLGHSVEIAIRDNGTGIPEEVKAKMFNPFFTTKPAGEGTGLGLSLSHDIVVKQHGGTLEVFTELGAYTQFTIVLPRQSGVGDEK